MSLYLDGKLGGTEGNTLIDPAQSGDCLVGVVITWDGSGPYLQATVDEVAVYSKALTAAQVATHRTLGASAPAANKAPTAAFPPTVSNLTVSVDASASTDTDGSIASYAWSFGDGSTGI